MSQPQPCHNHLPSQDTVERPLYAPDGDISPRFGTCKRNRKWLGLDHHRPLKVHEEGSEYLLWPRIRTTFQEPFAEFLGTMVLTMFYYGSLAQSTLSAGIETAPGGNGYGSYMSVPWGLGIGVMLGIYISGDSGSYLNPAITLAHAIFRRLPIRSVPILVIAQFLGAFVGTALVYANYVPAIDWYSGHDVRAVTPMPNATASIFATYPSTFVPKASQIISVMIPSALMNMIISALKDDYNNGIAKGGGNFFPLSMFFLFYGLTIAFGWETGVAINPALDFAGRLMSNILGYRREVWIAGSHYFWIPIVFPLVGGIFGSWLYDMLVYTGPSPINSPYLGLLPHIKPSLERRNYEAKKCGQHETGDESV